MNDILISGLRCFKSPKMIPLAPLTVLVGENSTGKSTFMSAIRLAYDVCGTAQTPDFNEDPYELGTWDSIAHYHGGQGKRVNDIMLGLHIDLPIRAGTRSKTAETIKAKIEAHFVENLGEPKLSKWTMQTDDMNLIVDFDEKVGSIFAKYGEEEITRNFPSEMSNIISYLPFLIQHKFAVNPSRFEIDEGGQISRDSADKIYRILSAIEFKLSKTSRPLAIAPIRTRPMRTYNPLRSMISSEGEHAPVVMSRMSAVDPESWEKLSKSMSRFANRAGLFSEIKIRHFGGRGKKVNQAFSLEVGIAGQVGQRTLVDVGYGVSQTLPILFDLLNSDKNTFLIQQPEVHLHPRAQAELGSLFVELVQKSKRNFVVETHSDYLVDRIATAIRAGAFAPDKFILLFFSHKESEVDICPIQFGSDGLPINPPDHYRDFFIKEKLSTLGL